MAADVETPLPRKQVFVLMCVQLSEALSINMLFPVVPFLVRSFPEVDGDDPSAVSSIASIVASAFNAAQFISSFWWGSASDRFGRRPTMLLGLLGSLVCIVAFGCASNLVGAITIRVLHGLLNGNAGVAKTYMREITDSSNQARGMGLFSTFWGIGSFVGPAISGFLSYPADKFPDTFAPDGLFGRHPFLLPSLSAGLVTALGGVLGYFYLEETVADPQQCPCRLRRHDGRGAASASSEASSVAAAAEAAAAASRRRKYESAAALRPGCFGRAPRAALGAMLRQPGVALVLALYAGLAWVMACLQELFPLWASTTPAQGGLGFGTTDIGEVQMVMGVALITYTWLLLPWVNKRLGSVRMFQVFAGVYVPVCVLTPFVHGLATVDGGGPRTGMWVALVTLYIFRSIAGPTIFTAIQLLLNNSAQHDVGALNGFATSVSALSRSTGPVLAGQMLAWGQANGAGMFPLDYHFPFFVVAGVVLLCTAVTRCLPKGIDVRVEERGGALAAAAARAAAAAAAEEEQGPSAKRGAEGWGASSPRNPAFEALPLVGLRATGGGEGRAREEGEQRGRGDGANSSNSSSSSSEEEVDLVHGGALGGRGRAHKLRKKRHGYARVV